MENRITDSFGLQELTRRNKMKSFIERNLSATDIASDYFNNYYVTLIESCNQYYVIILIKIKLKVNNIIIKKVFIIEFSYIVLMTGSVIINGLTLILL